MSVTALYPPENAPDGAATWARPVVDVGGSGVVDVEKLTVQAFGRDRLAGT